MPEWQPNPETRSSTKLALDADTSAKQAGDLARERKSEARAVDEALARVVDLRKILEDALVILACDPDAGIGHAEGHVVRLVVDRHPNLARLRELDCIRDEVAQ